MTVSLIVIAALDVVCCCILSLFAPGGFLASGVCMSVLCLQLWPGEEFSDAGHGLPSGICNHNAEHWPAQQVHQGRT